MTLVLVETDGGGVVDTSLEALTFARELAGAASAPAVEAVAVGPLSEQVLATVLDQLGEQGVTRLRRAADDRLARYGAAAWAASVVAAVRDCGTDLVLASGTPRGMEVMAHVAARLEATMAANVVQLDSAEPLEVSRQVLGGVVREQMQVGTPVRVLTLAGHAVEPAPAATATQPEAVEVAPELTDADLLTRVVRTEEGERDDTSALEHAKVVVGVGRGVGSAEGFDDLVELSELLGGVLGASRVVTSLGWRPHAEQVGQTGSRISPEVYLACGISGAIQHLAGIQGAKTVVAINTDPDAPMVTHADYAIIGDLHEVVPAVNAELRRRRGS